MIYYKVPIINDEVFGRARIHNTPMIEEKERVVKNAINRHGKAAKNHDWWERRQAEIRDLADLYFYLKEEFQDNKDYQSYIQRLEKMLYNKGLILGASSALPKRQFTAMLVEDLAMEAINKSNYNVDVNLPDLEEGKQDGGVDLIMSRNGREGIPFDVKTIYEENPVSEHSLLGKIKDHALSDKKQTKYILWAADNFEKGYITLKGREKWIDVKKSISENEWISKVSSNQEVYYVKERKRKPLKFHQKSLGTFDKSKVFNKEFIGDFDLELKEEINKASAWLDGEFKHREHLRTVLSKIKSDVDILVRKDPKELTKEEAFNVESTLSSINIAGMKYNTNMFEGQANRLLKYRENINTPTFIKLKEIDKEMKNIKVNIEIMHDSIGNFMTDRDRQKLNDYEVLANKYSSFYYNKKVLKEIKEKINDVRLKDRGSLAIQRGGIKISNTYKPLTKEEKEHIKKKAIEYDFEKE